MTPEDFVFAEAAMLDEHAYDDWLDLWEENCWYWVPFNRSVTDPASAVNLIYDDRARLNDRVHRLTSGDAHAQDPPSATSRLVGPVRLSHGAAWQPPGAVVEHVMESHFIITELRRGVRRQYTGKATHWLREAADAYRIAAKRVDLLEALGPLGNLTILL